MARGGPDAPGLLREVLRGIGQGWAPGLTVLTGGDHFHLDRAQRALIEALVGTGAVPFGVTVFSDQRVDVSAVVAAARSVGMFAERRVVLVRDLSAIEGDPEPLLRYAAEPPPASYLLVRALDLDRRRKLHQALAQAGRLLDFAAPGPADAPRLAARVVELAREKALDIARPAAQLLAEICGGDFYRIDRELEKIAVWSGPGRPATVTPDVLRELALGSAALSGWEVARAVLHRDRPAALEALARLLDAGEEPLRLLGGLAFRARSMLQARALIGRGVPPPRALAAARLWGEAPGPAAEGLSRYTLAELLSFPALLLEADRLLKSRDLAPGAVLGSMLERMLPPAAGAPAIEGR